MKIAVLPIVVCLLTLISCSKSNKEILQKVSNNISSIKTVKYDSRIEVIDNGQLLHNEVSSFAFDFENTETKEAKHYIIDERTELIYNGKESFQSMFGEKIIVHSNDNDLEQINNPMAFTLKPLIVVLPQLIINKQTTIVRERDTLISGIQLFSFSFLLQNRYIDWINAEIINREGDSKSFLYVDKKSYLPYKITIPNGKDGSISRTFENMELGYEFPDNFWGRREVPKDFTMVTQEEYFNNRKDNMLENIGEIIADFELPLVSVDEKISSTSLRGKIVLFEFWFKGCGPCIAAIPKMNDIQTKFKNYDFEIFGIEFHNKHSVEILQKYIKKENIKYPNLYLGKALATNYGIMHAPTFMILDKAGKIIFLDSGYSEGKIEEIMQIIESNS